MNINYDKINDIYGIYMLENIKLNMDTIVNNIKYLELLGFTDVEDIFERCVPIFLYDEKKFKEKINDLIQKLGIDYVYEIENNLELLEMFL